MNRERERERERERREGMYIRTHKLEPLASQILMVLSPDAVTRISGLVGCQLS